jgi:F0F1-type ATP synthase assembly protein I
MTELSCRVAKLEERMESMIDANLERRRQSDRTNELLEEIRNSLQSEISALKNEVSEIKGFSNGIKVGAMAVSSLIGSAITIVIDRIFNHS